MKAKDELLALIDSLRNAVVNNDVPATISLMSEIPVDTRKRSLIDDFLRELMTASIIEHISKKKSGKLKVERKSVYGESTFDFYLVKDGVLYRNGSDVKWSAIGKLYQAYKKINKIQ